MCYSRPWQADEGQKQREAEAREAQERRDGMINTLRTDAEKEAEKARKDALKTVSAK